MVPARERGPIGGSVVRLDSKNGTSRARGCERREPLQTPGGCKHAPMTPAGAVAQDSVRVERCVEPPGDPRRLRTRPGAVVLERRRQQRVAVGVNELN